MIDQLPMARSMPFRQDNRRVIIRPLIQHDHAALRAFGETLGLDDWLYNEDDFHNPALIARLVNAHAAENWRQLVAIVNNAIVGYAASRRLPGWSSHVADIQVIVSEGWRHNGLSTTLAQAIVEAARDLQVTKVIAELLEEQTGIIIFEHLGFCVEGVLEKHVRDRNGQWHNLLILSAQMR